MHCLNPPKTPHQPTTIPHHPPTTPPQKHHIKTPFFAKTPCKNAPPPHQKKSLKQKNERPGDAEPLSFLICIPPRQSAVAALHASVNNLFPHDLILHLLQLSRRQRHSQNLLNPGRIMNRHALNLVRR